MTPEQRTELIKNLNECDVGLALIQTKIDPISRELRPLIDEQAAIEERKFALADDLGVEILGQCVGCSCYLFSKDLGSQTTEGDLQCTKCSPSWKEIRESWEGKPGIDQGPDPFSLQEQEPEVYAALVEAYDSHIANGGKPEDVPFHIL